MEIISLRQSPEYLEAAIAIFRTSGLRKNLRWYMTTASAAV